MQRKQEVAKYYQKMLNVAKFAYFIGLVPFHLFTIISEPGLVAVLIVAV